MPVRERLYVFSTLEEARTGVSERLGEQLATYDPDQARQVLAARGLWVDADEDFSWFSVTAHDDNGRDVILDRDCAGCRLPASECECYYTGYLAPAA